MATPRPQEASRDNVRYDNDHDVIMRNNYDAPIKQVPDQVYLPAIQMKRIYSVSYVKILLKLNQIMPYQKKLKLILLNLVFVMQLETGTLPNTKMIIYLSLCRNYLMV